MSTMTKVCRWFHEPRIMGTVKCSPEMAGKETDTICEECMERLDEEDPKYQRDMRTLRKTRFQLDTLGDIMVQGYRK
jgi:hypothetical protein